MTDDNDDDDDVYLWCVFVESKGKTFVYMYKSIVCIGDFVQQRRRL